MKLKSLYLLALPATLAFIGATASAHTHGPELHLTPGLNANKIAQTDAAMRDLWVEHAFLVRNVVIAMAAGNNTATTAVEAEAVRNAQQIAKAMEGFYGKAGAEQLFELLAGHYGAVKQFATANLANDTALQDTAREAMLSNAGKLAVFLSAANPYLPIDAVRGMLLAHGGHHITQIMQLSSKNYAGEMQTWGEMKNHMYAIADAVTSALAMQFPEKFK